jgi:hypothetical protein
MSLRVIVSTFMDGTWRPKWTTLAAKWLKNSKSSGPTNVTNYCDLCLKQGKAKFLHLRLQDLERHVQEKHPGHPVIYDCDNCNKEYKTRRGVQRHRPKCPGPREEGHLLIKCSHCDRMFITPRALTSRTSVNTQRAQDVRCSPTTSSSTCCRVDRGRY